MSWARASTVLRTELRLAVRDGEQLLLALGLPLAFLVFFSQLDIIESTTESAVDFIAPGIVVLSILSIGFVRPAIALGFDRSFGAIKRFAVTPLRVSEFLLAKLLATVVLLVGQMVIIIGVAVALGWRPSLGLPPFAAVALSLIAFGAMAIILSSVIDGLTSLAVANALYVALLMISGLVFDVDRLPGAASTAAKLLPTTALASLLRHQLDPSNFASPGWTPWLVLLAWSLLASALAIRLFRWE